MASIKTAFTGLALIAGGLFLVCFVDVTEKPLQIEASEIQLNNKGLRTYQGHLFTGEVVSYHDNGELASQEQFLGGRRHGHARKWFATGKLAYRSSYISGRREGSTLSWWFNGNPRTKYHYVKGKAEGKAWSWYRNGNKFKEFNFIAGQPSGLQRGWRQNGKLFSNFEYKNGRTFGLKKANTCIGLEDEKLSFDYEIVQTNESTQANNS